MDGEAGWWTTSGNIGLPPLARVMGVGRQQQQQQLYITQDSTLCRVIQNLLSNRRFYVKLNNRRSRWGLQKNGLPQGSILSPTILNIYTNDQPVHDVTRNFIYSDDMCITAQFPTFSQVESTIKVALGELTEYYRNS